MNIDKANEFESKIEENIKNTQEYKDLLQKMDIKELNPVKLFYWNWEIDDNWLLEILEYESEYNKELNKYYPYDFRIDECWNIYDYELMIDWKIPLINTLDYETLSEAENDIDTIDTFDMIYIKYTY